MRFCVCVCVCVCGSDYCGESKRAYCYLSHPDHCCLVQNSPRETYFLFNFLFWFVVQPINNVGTASGGQQRDSAICLFHSPPDSPLIQAAHNIEQSSLCSAVGPCQPFSMQQCLHVDTKLRETKWGNYMWGNQPVNYNLSSIQYISPEDLKFSLYYKIFALSPQFNPVVKSRDSGLCLYLKPLFTINIKVPSYSPYYFTSHKPQFSHL